MHRIFISFLMAFTLSAQEPAKYIDLPGRPTAAQPLVATSSGPDLVFKIGDKQVILESFKFKMSLFSGWRITFKVRNKTDHQLENVALQFMFFNKAGELLSDPNRVPGYNLAHLDESSSSVLPITLAIPSDLKPDKAWNVDGIHTYLVSFKARRNAADELQAAREREQEELLEQEARQTALHAAQAKADAEAKAQREKEEQEQQSAASLKARVAEEARKKKLAAEPLANTKPLEDSATGAVTASQPTTREDSAMLTIFFPFLLLGIVMGGCFLAYSKSPAGKARKIAQAAVADIEGLELALKQCQDRAKENVEFAAKQYVLFIQDQRIRSISVDELKRNEPGIRLQALKNSGLSNLSQLQRCTANSYLAIRGIGPESASRIARAAANVIAVSNRIPVPLPLPGQDVGPERALLECLCQQERIIKRLADPNGLLPSIVNQLRREAGQIKERTAFSKWLSSFGKHPDFPVALGLADGMKAKVTEGATLIPVVGNLRAGLKAVQGEQQAGLPWFAIADDIAERNETYRNMLSSLLNNGRAAAVATGVPGKDVRPFIQVPSISSSAVRLQSTSTHARIPSTQEGKVAPDWVPQGQESTICGFRIPGGMIYARQTHVSASSVGADPSLINPSLRVQASAADFRTSRMGYYPSYDSISPDARASYLQWLSAGKSSPDADIGYVFLYFYGLERRVLVDAASHDAKAQAELPAIEQEIVRLLNIYKDKGTFSHYASSLLSYMRANQSVEVPVDIPLGRNDGLPFELKRRLGELASKGEPLPAEWAYAWYRSEPTTRRRTSFERCPNLFKQTFISVYGQRFPEGLNLPRNKTQLKISYRPANGALVGGNYTKELGLPDVSVLHSPVQKFQEIGETVNGILDPYSRFLGRNPGKEKALDAVMLLPIELWPPEILNPIQTLGGDMPWGKGIKVMRSVDFYSLFPEGAVTTKAKYAGLGRAFETIGIGIEPDLKFGGGLPSPNNLIALFRLSGAAPNRVASPSFDGAALLLQLAAAVASVDGTFGDQEAQLMLDHIKQGLELPEDEFQRLAARVEVYRSSPPHLTGLGKKVGALDPKTRVAIGDFLVQVVHADGIVHPSEVRSLEKIYGLLGLDVATLYSKLHVASSEPITVRPATEAGPSYQLPAPPQPPPPARADSGLKLDMAKVAALKADSARVSALLGSIFSEPPTDGITASMAPDNEADPQPSEEGKLLSSLDPDHRGLLHALLQRSQWTRSELEEMCADRSLMVDGAIERINEAAFEHYDQPIIEGDDPMDINCDLLVEETI